MNNKARLVLSLTFVGLLTASVLGLGLGLHQFQHEREHRRVR